MARRVSPLLPQRKGKRTKGTENEKWLEAGRRNRAEYHARMRIEDPTHSSYRRAGILSGIAKRRKKHEAMTFKETVRFLSDMKMDEAGLIEMGFSPTAAKILGGQVTHIIAATAAVFEKAMDGNIDAWKTLRDTVGEMPTIKTENNNYEAPPQLTVNFGDEAE